MCINTDFVSVQIACIIMLYKWGDSLTIRSVESIKKANRW